MALRCPGCGQRILRQDRECKRCGTDLTKAVQESGGQGHREEDELAKARDEMAASVDGAAGTLTQSWGHVRQGDGARLAGASQTAGGQESKSTLAYKLGFVLLVLLCAIGAVISYSHFQRLAKARDQAREQLAVAEEKASSLAVSLEKSEEQLVSAQAALAAARQELAGAEERLLEMNRRLVATEGRLELSESELAETKVELAKTQGQLESVRGELVKARQQLVAAEEQRTAALAEMDELSKRYQELEATHFRLEAVVDAYRALLHRDVTWLLHSPERLGGLSMDELVEADRGVVRLARRWGALRLFGTAQEAGLPDRELRLKASVVLWPSGYHVDDVYFLLAEIAEAEDLDQAMEYYRRVLSLTQGPWYHDDALYAIGKLLLAKGDRQQALAVFRRVLKEYPGSEGARLASLQLLQLERTSDSSM